MSSLYFSHTVTERFLRYVTIDTQSDPESPASPSTEKQKDLGRVLAAELKAIGVADAHLDDYGYVYGTIPANTDKKVPVICFCSHMDTSPDVTGKDVKPQMVKDYRGGDITLPGDTTPGDPLRRTSRAEEPDRQRHHHHRRHHALGRRQQGRRRRDHGCRAFLHQQPRCEARHDQDPVHAGRGDRPRRRQVDMKKLGADFGYTMDGESAGSVEDETFSADGATITINGVSAHPGYAKGKMEHAIKIAAAIVERLPKEGCSPETTSGKQGFLHPIGIDGALEQATLSFIVRDFTEEGLKEKEVLLENIVKDVMKDYPRSTYKFEVREQYRNMKQVIDRHPHILEYAIEAIRRAGLRPMRTAIRGGTDGSRLSFMGLPCPNIFAGEHAFHSRLEWVSRQDMEKAVQTIVHLAMIWEEKA